MGTRKVTDAATLHEAIRQQMPGWSLVRINPGAEAIASSDTIPPAADAVMPPLAELKRKFLGSALRDDAPPGTAADETAQTVTVESNGMRKTVGISAEGKVLWRQG